MAKQKETEPLFAIKRGNLYLSIQGLPQYAIMVFSTLADAMHFASVDANDTKMPLDNYRIIRYEPCNE